jgi:N-acetylmuramoyl-L-alanine amidase CwlA
MSNLNRVTVNKDTSNYILKDKFKDNLKDYSRVRVMVLNTTFNDISVKL